MTKTREFIRHTSTAVILVGFITHCWCYPYGPPASVCKDGLPIHVDQNGVNHPPQTSTCPFKIDINATSFKPGDVISVEVRSDQGEMFKGLFLQMRTIPSDDGIHVKNGPLPAFKRKIRNTKLTVCDFGWDTVTHQDPYMKMTAEFNWRSPLLANNDVFVRATILTNFSTYWTNVESQRIKLVRPDRVPAEELERPWLEEIIKTVKSPDKLTSRDLVKSRFERGYSGVVDPHGYIMVHYVMDLLPFHDSNYGVNVSNEINNELLGTGMEKDTNTKKEDIKGTNASESKQDERTAAAMNSTDVNKVNNTPIATITDPEVTKTKDNDPSTVQTNQNVTYDGIDKPTTESKTSDADAEPSTGDLQDKNTSDKGTTGEVNNSISGPNEMSRKAYGDLLKLVLNEDKDAVIQLEKYLTSNT